MSAVRKTITVTPQQDNYIKAQVAAGHYTNDSEYFRDLIRRDQDSEIAAIRALLVEAEQSGEPKPFDIDAFKKRMAKKVTRTDDSPARHA